MPVTFKGFSSPVVGNTQVLYDVELVKRDLLNHFNTKKGERVMDSAYGFIGWDLIFELENPSNKELLDRDSRRIVDQEPRVELLNIEVLEIAQGYRINMTMNFLELDTVDDLTMVFDRRSAERMSAQSF